MKRKKITPTIEADVMFLSNLKCCVDGKNGDHIHHLDGDNSNNSIDNLALLCFDCHNKASITGSLSKKLSAQVIKKFRAHHYLAVKTERDNSLKKISNAGTKSISHEDLITAASTAITLIEIAKIQEEYYSSHLMDRNETLIKLFAFKNQSNPRVFIQILQFLNRVVYETRAGLPKAMIHSISQIISSYFLLLNGKTTSAQIFELGKSSLQVAETIIYDTSIHSHKFGSMRIGYSIIKFVYDMAITEKNVKLKNEVQNVFDEQKRQLNRPERNDLGNAQLMRQLHFENLSLKAEIPINYPKDLVKLISEEK